MRKFILSALALSLGVSSFAADVTKTRPPDGYMTLTYGRVRQADGKSMDVAGLQFPYWIEKIADAKILEPVRASGNLLKPDPTASFLPFKPGPADLDWSNNYAHPMCLTDLVKHGRGGFIQPGNQTNVTVYNSDGGAGSYAFIDPAFPSPSIGDDMTINPAAIGKTWNQIGFAVGVDSTAAGKSPLMQWQAWSGYSPTGVTGHQDFQGEFLSPPDGFGGTFKLPATAGAYYITLGVSGANAQCISNQMYYALQWRTGANASFFPGVSSGFTINTPPSTGSSSNTFWFDSNSLDVLDGNYNSLEVEQLGDGNGNNYPSFLVANIQASSTSTTYHRPPTTFNLAIGTLVSGDINSVQFPDDSDLIVATPSYDVGRGFPNIAYDFTVLSPTSTPTALSLTTEAAVNFAPVHQITYLWDYTTSLWVQVGSVDLTGSAEYTTTIGYGGTVPLSHFVAPTGAKLIKGRIGFQDFTYSLGRWKGSVDFFQFDITSG